MYSPAFVEFLGTSLLVGSIAFTGSLPLIIGAFAIAVGLASKVSGAHLNPAVTAWALLSGKIGQAKAVSYMLAQIGAAVFIWVMHSFIKV